jgi:uncharacterized membrane protein YheB (UPF0754 family)
MYSLKAKALKANTTMLEAENMDDRYFENEITKQRKYQSELLDQIEQDRTRKDMQKRTKEELERIEEEKLMRY